MKQSSIKTLIFGSCVTRDAFEIVKNRDFVLIDYYARSSIASAFCETTWDDINVEGIDSDFQRRIVKRDIGKSFRENLPHQEFDILLIDFIDERFDLWCSPSGALCTLSGELLQTKPDLNAGRLIPCGSEEWWRLWVAGWKLLISDLDKYNALSKLRIHRSYWTEYTESGTNFMPIFSDEKISKANDILRKIYEIIKEYLGDYQFVDLPEQVRLGSESHKWGKSPFHYVDRYYACFIDKLRLSIDGPPEVRFSISDGVRLFGAFHLSYQWTLANKGVSFAFYVMLDGHRIYYRPYSESYNFNFEFGLLSGFVRVRGFIKDKNGNISIFDSDARFANPTKAKLIDICHGEKDGKFLDISFNGLSIPALYFSSKTPRLFVMFSADFNRIKIHPPVFNRWTWARDGVFPGHVLCIADPTVALNEHISLGWYLGNFEVNVTEIISQFICDFALSKNISQDEIYLWGSSGGGFAALAHSLRVPFSTAVVINPQTNIFSYNILRHANIIRNVCFKGESSDSLCNKDRGRFDLVHAFGSRSNNSRVIYMQNELDVHHFEDHFKPFWESVGRKETSANPVGDTCWLYRDERGHVGESVDMVRDILKLAGLE